MDDAQDARRRFWEEFAAAHAVTAGPSSIHRFGDTREMSHELARLVLAGTKRAAVELVVDRAGAPLPRAGDLSLLLDGDGAPAAVLVTTEHRVGTLASVEEDFVWEQGEGDRSLLWWMQAHVTYFRRRCEVHGIGFRPDLEVGFERFEVVWPAGAADGEVPPQPSAPSAP